MRDKRVGSWSRLRDKSRGDASKPTDCTGGSKARIVFKVRPTMPPHSKPSWGLPRMQRSKRCYISTPKLQHPALHQWALFTCHVGLQNDGEAHDYASSRENAHGRCGCGWLPRWSSTLSCTAWEERSLQQTNAWTHHQLRQYFGSTT